jgi:hypothetical protein
VLPVDPMVPDETRSLQRRVANLLKDLRHLVRLLVVLLSTDLI